MRKDIILRKNDILKWIDEEQPKNFICRELKCKPLTLNNWLKEMNIDYKGSQGWAKNKILSNRWVPAEDYLNKNSLTNSHRLKNKLIRDGIKEKKCEKCNNIVWNGMEIPLELHHIDGNRFNNLLENLQMLCPNCHSQTSNNSGKSSKLKLIKRKQIKRNKLKKCECGKMIDDKSNFCGDCQHIKTRKVERPNKEILMDELKSSNYTQVGKKYGVSDNSIRKWVRYYSKK